MKPADVKTDFIRLRAEGKSYTAISQALRISKDTCSKWERELKFQIAELKKEQLNELYDSYYMFRAARIKQLGSTLSEINTALDRVDLSELPPERLLDFKLKYTEALKAEYIDLENVSPLKDNYDANDILNNLGDLLTRLRNGNVTPEQASRESIILSNVLKAYETVEVKERLDVLEQVVGRR